VGVSCRNDDDVLTNVIFLINQSDDVCICDDVGVFYRNDDVFYGDVFYDDVFYDVYICDDVGVFCRIYDVLTNVIFLRIQL